MNLRSVLPGGHGRRLRVRRGAATVVAVGLAMLGGIAVTATSASAIGDKVWVCHATSSDTNPYRIIHVDVSSTKYKGHLAHKTTPNKTWNNLTTFGGSDHAAGSDKPDIIGDVGDDAPPTTCGAREVVTANASLTLVKHVSGSNDSPSRWMLHAAGTSEGASTFAPGRTGVNHEVADGTYNLSESDGPTDGYTNAGWNCDNATENGTRVTIAADDTDVTCTITNTFTPTVREIVTPHPSISLEKFATVNESDSDLVAQAGESITYTFSVKNTGDVALSDVTVIDALAGVGPVTCDATALAVGATMSCAAAAFPVTTENATGADIVNVATASGRPPTGSRVEATDTVSTPTGGAVEEVVTVRPAEVPTQVVKGAVVTNAPVVAPAQVESLAFTGAETVPLGLSGLLALLLGAGLVATTRRQGRRANN